jgi:hypothetical protein
MAGVSMHGNSEVFPAPPCQGRQPRLTPQAGCQQFLSNARDLLRVYEKYLPLRIFAY